MMTKNFNPACPIPISNYPKVLMAHGGGGSLMNHLIRDMFAAALGNDFFDQQHDAAVLPGQDGQLAFSTDSYTVHPLFFPGGDIGDLAVNGTVNDLAMAGAEPKYLSLGFILEEGLPMEDLWRIVCSIRQAAELAGVQIVTGDTKVVDKGKGDGIYINTSGVGVIAHGLNIGPRSVRPGDCIVVNGDIGRHGMAIMAVREGLEFESEIESDTAPLAACVQALISAGIDVHCLRDLTRGGLASALNEIAGVCGLSMNIRESDLPVREDVASACEILGFEPVYVANEGRFAAFVPPDQAEKTLTILNDHFPGQNPTLIGRVSDSSSAKPRITMQSAIGINRIIDMLSGEQLPRIC